VLAAARSEREPRRAARWRDASTRPRRRTLIVAASAIALCAALAGAVVLDRGSREPDDVRIAASVRGASAALARVGADAELQLAGMPQPPVGEVYEVWLVRAAAPPQATDALFTVTSSGRASVEVPGELRGVREVMVTAEPLGGSASPTSAAVLRVILARGQGC
jgi:anti-sigma-K factor RskA